MTGCTRYKPEPPLLSLTVKLLCTNKQINEEGTGILYEHNTFGFRLEYCFSGRFSSHIFRIRHLKLKIIQVPQERTKNWVTPKLVNSKAFTNVKTLTLYGPPGEGCEEDEEFCCSWVESLRALHTDCESIEWVEWLESVR